MELERDGNGKKRVRTACTSCRRRKIRCDGGFPCEQCVKMHYTCEYDSQVAKRPAMEGNKTAIDADTQMVAYAPARTFSPLVFAALPRELSFNGVSFGTREMQHINVYLQRIHSNFPLVPYSILRDGVNPVSLEMLGLPREDDTAKMFASKATSWAAAALGASFSDVNLASDYIDAAIRNIRQCFEVPCEESVMAYIIVGEASYQLGKPELFLRYAEFADAMEETMPALPQHVQLALAACRQHVFSVSNRSRFYPKATILPPLADIHQMDIRYRIIFLSQFNSQKIEEVIMNPAVPREDKVRVCHELIDILSPLLDEVEGDPQYSNFVLGKVVLCLPLAYCWAVCGDKEKALSFCSRLLDLIEKNVYYMAMPEMHHLQFASSFLKRLGATQLQRRLDKVMRDGSKYAIWTPARTVDVDVLLHLEALVDDLQEAQSSTSVCTIAEASDSSPMQGFQQPSSTDFADDAEDLWDILDELPNAFELFAAP